MVSLKLTFGGAPCPNEFCIISELCADLGNDILHSHLWNPKELHSPHTINLPLDKDEPDNSEFAQAHPLDVDIQPDTKGRTEMYIDNGITVIPDIGHNRLRGTNAMALALHTICRPLSPFKPISRDDCL